MGKAYCFYQNYREVRLLVIHCSATRYDRDFPVEALRSSHKARGYIRFKTGKNEVIKAIVGTSFISVEQARINLEREIGAKSMETISAQTEALWNKELSVIDLPGATEHHPRL